MYQHHQGILTIPAAILIEAANLPEGTYKKYTHEKKIEVVRRGCFGTPALVKFGSLAKKYKDAIIEKIGKPEDAPKYTGFKNEIGVCQDAVNFFTTHPLVLEGTIKPERMHAYIASANVLAAIHVSHTKTMAAWAKNGKRPPNFWKNMAEAVKSVYDIQSLPHDLPKNDRKLQEAYKLYIAEGFESLISAKYGNKYALKVDEKLERLLMAAYTMKNKPFVGGTNHGVHNTVTLFLMGKLDIADSTTGELLNPADFTKNGKPIEISDTTVWNWLNKPDNRAIVDKKRMGGHRYNGVHRPHNHRHSPTFSLSKISLDDRELSRPYVTAEGRSARVVQYLAYDVASGAIVGFAHSKKKDAGLFEATLHNMFTTLSNNKLGMPLEAEVENHLVSQYFDRLRAVFTHVSVCAPGNSQQKRAEHFNRILKYTVERPQQGPQVGRHYGRSEAYQYDRDLVNNEFTEKAYGYDRLVADAIHAINTYNAQPHPKHKGLSRWDVLLQTQNPDCPAFNWQTIARHLGEVTETSIQRNHKLQVQYAQYALPNPQVLRKLKPNNTTVQAYYLRAADGTIPQVYVYQGDTFIASADMVRTYNEALAERTPADWKAFGDQNKRTAAFDGMVKDRVGQLSTIVEVNTTAAAIEEATEVVQVMASPVESDEYDLNNLTFDGSAIEGISKKSL